MATRLLEIQVVSVQSVFTLDSTIITLFEQIDFRIHFN